MKHSLQSLLPLQATPRGWRYTGFWTILLLLFLLQPIHSQPPVDVTITSDNAYVFGFGDVNGIITLLPAGGVTNCTMGEVYLCPIGPETYTSIPATLDGYIYIVAWSDKKVYQGTIAEFTNGSTTILTKPGLPTPWEVFATGIDVDATCPGADPAPSLSDINYQIGLANTSAGPSGSSVTWVNETSAGSDGRLEFDQYTNGSGISNNPDPPMPPADVCGIGSAQWMWYNPSPGVITDPFVVGVYPNFPASEMREYYIFRIGPLGDVFEIPTLTEWGMIIFGVVLLGFITWVFLKRRKAVVSLR